MISPDISLPCEIMICANARSRISAPCVPECHAQDKRWMVFGVSVTTGIEAR
jgi:hypothetical protein